jgi:tRNA threonylcarbamoyladenosine biosynthesis protein TsaE
LNVKTLLEKNSSPIVSSTPDESYELGVRIGGEMRPQDVILLSGELGAGKTLLTKGMLEGLDFDADEVTSPSFTLVNLYKTTNIDVFHIDLWRLETSSKAEHAVGLDEILENPRAAVIIEWPDRLSSIPFSRRVFSITIRGDGDDPRVIEITNISQKTP